MPSFYFITFHYLFDIDNEQVNVPELIKDNFPLDLRKTVFYMTLQDVLHKYDCHLKSLSP